MRIGFYSPYFDSLAGGERYVLTLASHWSRSHDVSLFWDDPEYCQKAQDRFNLDLTQVKIVPNVFKEGTVWSKLAVSRTYDCLFFLSDGSIPVTGAKHNILHFQVPFARIAFPFWKRNMYETVVVNSQFTKTRMDPVAGKGSIVIYPPVAVEAFTPSKKTKTIVSVGRFSPVFQAKKQDVLIEAFRKGWKEKKLKGWKLLLLGGMLPSDASYLEELRQKAKGLPVEFHPNCSFSDLKKYYSHATLYWHAAGFGESDPVKMEHFGITTVEAMAAGCIPLVYDAGGQKEIVDNGDSGYLWDSIDELLIKTVLATSDSEFSTTLSNAARQKAQKFSQDVFYQAFDGLLKSI